MEVGGGSSDWLYDTRDGLRETRARLLLDSVIEAATGLPWTWEAAGTYRVYADFVPADTTDGPEAAL